MRVFVAGATGVVGIRVVPLLRRAGHHVTAVSRSPDKSAVMRAAGADPVQVDLFDPAALRASVARHDVVINLATHMPSLGFAALLPGAWAENDRIRRTVSANLAEAAIAAGARRLIQESFAVYPDCGDAWIDERTPIRPARYNRTIADAERAAHAFSGNGRSGVILRFAAFYGPDAVQLPQMIGFVRKGWAPVPSRPDAFLSSVSHDDAAAAVVAALTAGPGAYNVDDDEPLRRRDYFAALAATIGAPPPRIPPAWLAMLFGSVGKLLARSQRMSNRKLRAETGWAPKYPSVREGFRATIEALEHGRPPTAAAA